MDTKTAGTFFFINVKIIAIDIICSKLLTTRKTVSVEVSVNKRSYCLLAGCNRKDRHDPSALLLYFCSHCSFYWY